MKTPVVKRQTSPEDEFCAFFPPWRSWRRHPLATCSGVVALGWRGHHVATPHTYWGATAINGDYRESWYGILRPRNLSVPSYRPPQTRGCTSLCASEVQVRVRGRT